MKIAFFSDIHANIPALEAGYTRAIKAGVEKFVSCGDMLGSGPYPSETIHFLKENNFLSISGNIERKLGAGIAISFKKKKKFPNNQKGNLAWTLSSLESADIEWISALPKDLFFAESDMRIKAVHGSPKSDTDYIYPSITNEGLKRLLDFDLPDILVCGHSHIPFVKRLSGILVVNCGSVGRSVDGDTSGSFALLDIKRPGVASARIIRFHYPLERLIAQIQNRNTPGILIEEYMLGIKKKGA